MSMEMLNPVRYIWRSTRWAANCAVADRLAVSWANLRRASAQQRAGAGANRHYKLVSRVRAEVHVSVLWIALCSHRRFPDHAGRQMPSVTDRTERACDSGQNARLAALRSQFRAMIALCSHRMLPGHADRQMPSVTDRTERACDYGQNAQLATLRSQFRAMIVLCSQKVGHAGQQMPSFTGRTERACDSGQNARLATLRSQCSAMIALCSHRRFPGHAGRQMPSVTGRTECACDSCQNAWLTALRSQCKSFPVNRHNLHNCSNICHKSFTGKR